MRLYLPSASPSIGPAACSSGTSGAGSVQYPKVKRQRVRPVRVPMASGATARASSATCRGLGVRGGAKGVQGGARGCKGGARGCRGDEKRRHHHVDDTEAACGGDEADGGEHEGDRGVTLAQHA